MKIFLIAFATSLIMLRFVLNTFYIYTVLFVIFQEVCGRRHHHVRVSSQPSLYLNEFTVKINGNNEVASAIARRNGFINLGQVNLICRK